MVRDPVAQQIAGHQQVTGEVIGFTLDGADGVDAGVDAFLVAVEALLLAAMQDEVAQLVGDGETAAFRTGLAVVEDAPLGGVVRVAYDFSFWEHHGPQTQQYDLGLKRQPNSSDTNLAGLRNAISAFYKREMQCGDSSVAHLVERSPGVFLLTVHVKDMAMLRLEFEGATLKRRVGNPNIHMVLEYAKTTGVVRTLVRGGQKYQQMLVEAFAEHVLGVKASASRIKSPTLDLSMLRTGFDVPEAFADGFSMVQLKALTFLSPDGALKLECTAMQSSHQRSVHELLKEKLNGPLEGNWTVTAAQVNLYYPPEPGRTRAKVVTIEVTSKGRLNLHKFDAKMQAQLEGYLVAVGILQKGQTLSAHEIPPETDAVGSTPVIED